MELSRSENIVLSSLMDLDKKGISKLQENDMVKYCALNSTEISSAISWLDFKKLINVERNEYSDYYGIALAFKSFQIVRYI